MMLRVFPISYVNWPCESPGVHPLRIVRLRRSQNWSSWRPYVSIFLCSSDFRSGGGGGGFDVL